MLTVNAVIIGLQPLIGNGGLDRPGREKPLYPLSLSAGEHGQPPSTENDIHHSDALDRRPIPVRDRRLSQTLCHALVRTGLSSNTISLFGLLAGLAGGVLLALSASVSWETTALVAATILIPLRLLAHMLDGMVAVSTGKTTRVGELYNEIPDRISDAATLIGAGYVTGGHPLLGWTAALLAVFVAYVRVQGRLSGADHEFCGPMSKPQRMFALTAGVLFTTVVPEDWQPTLEAFVTNGGMIAAVLVVIILGSLVTAIRRLRRIVRRLKELDT